MNVDTLKFLCSIVVQLVILFFGLQMTHVESAIEVVHLHNIER